MLLTVPVHSHRSISEDLKQFLCSYSKCGDLEEELKNVTNNLKSLEAQSDKASVVHLSRSVYKLLGVSSF